MRTAVVRVDVDPAGDLTRALLAEGMRVLRKLADSSGIDVVDNNLAEMPVGRRQVELLIAGTVADDVKATGIAMCAKAFGTSAAAGVVTYISRGTDDDAYGVLERFGLRGEIRREPGQEGFDVVYVTLSRADLEHIPESRIHTALEASLNCEVRIQTE
ncbi:MAG TPA: hypothetical protein VMU34_19370 [Mycobacterium sp.]|nr:hypothetical protein [Mycobacterium sp.]